MLVQARVRIRKVGNLCAALIAVEAYYGSGIDFLSAHLLCSGVHEYQSSYPHYSLSFRMPLLQLLSLQ